ncbi:MAG: type IV pilus modification PilV family protein [Gemmatimonadales bacterium]
MQRERGFTVVEVVVAILVFTVALLGLASTAGSVTRMVARGQRSAVAATFAAQRLEQLRRTACTSRVPGSEDLYRGGTRVAWSQWRFTDAGRQTYRVLLTTTYVTTGGRQRTDTLETAVSCLV